MPRLLHFGGPRTGASRIAFIATPSNNGFSAPYVMGALATQLALQTAGIDWDIAVMSGHCHVDDARNELVAKFLKTDCTDIVFIDSDQGWCGVDVVKLMLYDADVVGGAPPYKSDDGGFGVRTEPGEEIWAGPDGLVEVISIGTGFLKISRAAIKKVAAGAGRYAPSWDRSILAPIIFERTCEQGANRFSGDISFCNKWRALDGKVFVDPEMTFEHLGGKSWTGCLGDWWKENYGNNQ